jgi:hypothetical protein
MIDCDCQSNPICDTAFFTLVKSSEIHVVLLESIGCLNAGLYQKDEYNKDDTNVSSKAATRIYKAKLAAAKMQTENMRSELSRRHKEFTELEKQLEAANVEKVGVQKHNKALEAEVCETQHVSLPLPLNHKLAMVCKDEGHGHSYHPAGTRCRLVCMLLKLGRSSLM